MSSPTSSLPPDSTAHAAASASLQNAAFVVDHFDTFMRDAKSVLRRFSVVASSSSSKTQKNAKSSNETTQQTATAAQSSRSPRAAAAAADSSRNMQDQKEKEEEQHSDDDDEEPRLVSSLTNIVELHNVVSKLDEDFRAATRREQYIAVDDDEDSAEQEDEARRMGGSSDLSSSSIQQQQQGNNNGGGPTAATTTKDLESRMSSLRAELTLLHGEDSSRQDELQDVSTKLKKANQEIRALLSHIQEESKRAREFDLIAQELQEQKNEAIAARSREEERLQIEIRQLERQLKVLCDAEVRHLSERKKLNEDCEFECATFKVAIRQVQADLEVLSDRLERTQKGVRIRDVEPTLVQSHHPGQEVPTLTTTAVVDVSPSSPLLRPVGDQVDRTLQHLHWLHQQRSLLKVAMEASSCDERRLMDLLSRRFQPNSSNNKESSAFFSSLASPPPLGTAVASFDGQERGGSGSGGDEGAAADDDDQ